MQCNAIDDWANLFAKVPNRQNVTTRSGINLELNSISNKCLRGGETPDYISGVAASEFLWMVYFVIHRFGVF